MKMKKFINAPETITWTWTAIWLSAATWPARTG